MPEHTWVVSWDCEADGDDEPLHVQGMSVNAWCHFIEKKPRRKKPGKRRPFDPEKIFAAMSVFSVRRRTDYDLAGALRRSVYRIAGVDPSRTGVVYRVEIIATNKHDEEIAFPCHFVFYDGQLMNLIDFRHSNLIPPYEQMFKRLVDRITTRIIAAHETPADRGCRPADEPSADRTA